MLSGLMQDSQFQNIWLRGQISLDDKQGIPYLLHEGNRIRCFTPNNANVSHTSLLTEGKMVAVYGDITLFPRFSEYQIRIRKVQLDEANEDGNSQLFTVSNIIDRLEKITTNYSKIQQIRVRGEILHFESPPDQPWYLSDPSDGDRVTDRNQKIHCFTNSELANSTVLCKDGGAVRIQGAIRIWGAFSRYQIHVERIEPDVESDNSSNTQCQCSGCESCQPQGVNQQCPPLQDPEYELCAKCYHESPDREDRVAQAVYAYFHALGGNGFSPQKERQIQMGADNRKADVVLIRDGTDTFAAIAECKGAGYEGNGRSQLNSYLSASNTRFGIFANRADPSQWEFYKEQGRNQYESITCDQFKKEVKELTDPDLPSTRDRIDTLESENEQLKQTQRSLKEKFDRIKVFLTSAMQEVDQVKKED